MTPQVESYVVFSQALSRVLARPKLRQELMELETSEGALQRLNITEDMANELKLILAKIPSGGEAETPHASGEGLEAEAKTAATTADEFLSRSFRHLQIGAWVLMAMSVTMFLIGVSFLVIAAIRSFTHPEDAGVTAVIAGVGVAQIVLLFYRNPLRDIGRSTSDAQQSKLIVMSYMLGVKSYCKEPERYGYREGTVGSFRPYTAGTRTTGGVHRREA